ncbi:MAG: hypothetical protein ACXAEF_06850 [Candidatus Thorarchaeota archaeon]|jgi:hypothetical protein
MKNKIQMNVYKPRLMKSFMFLITFLLIGIMISPVAAQDTLRPEIYGWGIDGEVVDGASYTVWANVTDNDSGILNVSARVRQDSGVPVTTPMTFNDTFYTVTLPGVETNHTYTIWIVVYDVAENIATSYTRSFNLFIDPDPPLDPLITLPYVISVSIMSLVAVLGFSYEYNKRNPRDGSTSEEELDETNEPTTESH